MFHYVCRVFLWVSQLFPGFQPYDYDEEYGYGYEYGYDYDNNIKTSDSVGLNGTQNPGGPTAPPTDCPTGWSAFNGKCYKYFSEMKTWEDAEDHCVKEEVRC